MNTNIIIYSIFIYLFNLKLLDPFGKNLAVKKKRVRQGFLRIWYTPQIIGLHEISITKNGIRLQREVIGIFVSDPNKVKIENVAKNSLVNQKFSFNIDAAQAGEGFIRVNIKGIKATKIKITKKISFD